MAEVRALACAISRSPDIDHGSRRDFGVYFDFHIVHVQAITLSSQR
jgi:hypothetical protein